MSDYPDFTKPISFKMQEAPDWSRREWAAKEYEFKSWRDYGTAVPDVRWDNAIYTVPTGKRLYITDCQGLSRFKSWMFIYTIPIVYLFNASQDWYDSKNIAFATPIPLEAGIELWSGGRNFDIITDSFEFYINAFETPASNPEIPKTDDPEERYKLGDFNFANLFHLEDDQTLILFHKVGDKRQAYLKFSNFLKPKEKKLASFYLKPEGVKEIIDISHTNPKKLKETLDKIEKRYQ